MGRRLRVVVRAKEKNSMCYWAKVRNPLRVALNYIVVSVCRILPSLGLKRWLLRRIGVKVGKNVAFGLESTVDVFYPELIEIGDDTIIGYNTVILAHEFLRNELRVGEVKIGKGVTIGANCTILPGISIGDNSIIAAHSLVNSDIPPNVLAGGVPARVLRELV